MKNLKGALFLSLFLWGPLPLGWSEVALVYQSEKHVLEGQSTLGVVTAEGVLISADFALEASSHLFLAPVGKELHEGSLLRLDTQVNVALIELKSVVKDSALQEAHILQSKRFLRFQPNQGGAQSNAEALGFSLDDLDPSRPFSVFINDKPLSGDEIVLSVARRQSEFKLTAVRRSSTTVWRVIVEMQSDPQLGFWKKGRKKGLNDIPKPILRYSYQALFKPISQGKSFSIPIKVHHIKEENYIWRLKLSTKEDSWERHVKVRFVKS